MKTADDCGCLSDFIRKMQEERIDPLVIDTFSYYYRKVISGETGLIHEQEIEPLTVDELEDAENLGPYTAAGKGALKNTVMIVLNGGLGTSMGLTGAKSLLEAKNGKTFLGITLAQTAAQGVKLCLMNSFSTHENTLAAVARSRPAFQPIYFLQHKFPKIRRDGLSPVGWPENPQLEWNPPGHGDVYTALYTSGTLQQLIDAGIRYAFISNSDNLGGTVEEAVLGYFVKNNFPFMMEVAPRTPSDVKGGHLARLKNGRLILREIAQCPKADLSVFQDIGIHRFFNTNNIWINLSFLKALIDREAMIRLPMILNPKDLDPRDASSPAVYQVETAMGSAISLFPGATAIQVPKSRLLPVKTCNDLLAIRSDCYILTEGNRLIWNPGNRFPAVTIELDPNFYGKIDQFDQRFPQGAPSLIECESLRVEGDILFQKNVRIRGRVVVKNINPQQAVIPSGTVIDRDLKLGV